MKHIWVTQDGRDFYCALAGSERAFTVFTMQDVVAHDYDVEGAHLAREQFEEIANRHLGWRVFWRK